MGVISAVGSKRGETESGVIDEFVQTCWRMRGEVRGSMKRRLRRLIVFAGVVGLVMVVNMGVASATHGENENSPFVAAEENDVSPPADAMLTPGAIPVGSHILAGDLPGQPPLHPPKDQLACPLTAHQGVGKEH